MALTKVQSEMVGGGPAFYAYGTNSQSGLSSGSTTKVTFNTTVFDTASAFNTSTSRFVPQVAGYYQLNYTTYVTGNLSQIQINLYKNGSQSTGQSYMATTMSSGAIVSASTIIYMNGSTDYVEVYLYAATASGTFTIQAAQANTFFNGALVRTA